MSCPSAKSPFQNHCRSSPSCRPFKIQLRPPLTGGPTLPLETHYCDLDVECMPKAHVALLGGGRAFRRCVGPKERSLGHLGPAPKGNCDTTDPFSSSLFCHEVSTSAMMRCLTQAQSNGANGSRVGTSKTVQNKYFRFKLIISGICCIEEKLTNTSVSS